MLKPNLDATARLSTLVVPVQVLPIVERELRVAARQPRTWWRRMLALAGTALIFAFVWMFVGRWQSSAALGRAVFSVFTVIGFIYSLLAGPMATADCLSRERREGTLGLLFLTDLGGWDVVLGKVVASSADVFLGLMATLPLLSLPILMGGVTLAHFGEVVLMLANVMLLSLAVGALTSSFCHSGRASVAVTILILLFLTVGLPFIGEELLRISARSILGPYLYMTSPLWAMTLCLQAGVAVVAPGYWLSMAGLHGLTWIVLVICSSRTAKHWHEEQDSRFRTFWRQLVERARTRNRGVNTAWRRRWLAINPLAWLETRDRLQGRALAVLIGGCALLWAGAHLRAPSRWPGNDAVVFLWAAWSHYLFCVWVAIQAPRRLADDKQSGALELLLCTSFNEQQIVRGMMMGLWRRFGRAMIALICLDGFLCYAHISQNPGVVRGNSTSFFFLCFWAVIVFLLQGFTFVRVGLYQGLLRGNSIKATFNLVFTVGVLPWVVFALWMFIVESLRRFIPPFGRIRELFVFNSWAAAHLLVFGTFLAHASFQLTRRFRLLAANPSRPWFQSIRARCERLLQRALN